MRPIYTTASAKAKLVAQPCLWPNIVGKQPSRKIQFAFAMNVGWLQPTFLAILSLLYGMQISKSVFKGKKFMECY